MKFRKFHSLENSYQDEYIADIRKLDIENLEFVVQEKVHGANLSFWTNGQDINVAKRTGFIEADDDFYGYKSVLKNYQERINQVYELTKVAYPETKVITIFGELFGGGYPHQEIPKIRNVSMVQNGIFYSPNIEFYAFDIRLDNEIYLDITEINELFNKSGFLFAKTLFKGSFDEALSFSNQFDSFIPEWLNLPKIENNICEGVVIKPISTTYFPSGSRVIIKNKNEKWAENKRHHKVFFELDEPSEILIKLKEIILDYITHNRLNNVISKIGEVSKKDFGRLMKDFCADILEDFIKDYNKEFESLDKTEQKLIRKSISPVANKLINQKLEKADNKS